eukprot:GFYU01003048.1.p1 GENE.GFYU01003048.1~~GFYU01003048.1.p1  ORF type:complete len:431 (-),score=133.05 GFYU01003048.1:214-1362(-)
MSALSTPVPRADSEYGDESEEGGEGVQFNENVVAFPVDYYQPTEEFMQLWKVWAIKAMREGQRSKIFGPKGDYKGFWHKDAKHGDGTFTYKDGSKYEGGFVNGRREGAGAFWKMRNGRLHIQFKGQWKNGSKEGHGTCWFANGDIYEGDWSQNLKHGDGTLRYENGDVYEGHFFEDRRHGFGVMTLASGDRYDGFWQHDKRHGPGIYYYVEKNRVMEAEWVEDVPKCGVFSELDEPTKKPNVEYTTNGVKRHDFGRIPPSQIADPLYVLNTAIDKIRSKQNQDIDFMEHFSEEELKIFRRAFAYVDKGRKGYITSLELVMLLQDIGEDPTEKEIDIILGIMGKRMESRITFEEFVQMLVLYKDKAEFIDDEDGDYDQFDDEY